MFHYVLASATNAGTLAAAAALRVVSNCAVQFYHPQDQLMLVDATDWAPPSRSRRKVLWVAADRPDEGDRGDFQLVLNLSGLQLARVIVAGERGPWEDGVGVGNEVIRDFNHFEDRPPARPTLVTARDSFEGAFRAAFRRRADERALQLARTADRAALGDDATLEARVVREAMKAAPRDDERRRRVTRALAFHVTPPEEVRAWMGEEPPQPTAARHARVRRPKW